MTPPMIELAHFALRLSSFSLGPIDLTLAPGERVALVGPNGAGKSTTMLALAGRRTRYEGEIRFRGADLRAGLPLARAEVGLLAEDAPSYPWMTVAQHLALCAAFYPAWDDAYAAHLLHLLGVDPKVKMGTLSKGSRVKAAFVAAEAPRPPLLLLDEPTSGLDPIVRDALLRVIDAAVPHGGGRTVVLSTHLLEDVETLADRVLVLRGGRLVADVAVGELQAGASRRSVAAQLRALLTHDSNPTHDPPLALACAHAA